MEARNPQRRVPCPGAHSSTTLVRIPQCRYRPPTLGTPTINPLSLPHPRGSMKTNALIIVSRATNAVAPAPTTPLKAEETTESIVEVMVRGNLPATGVNTGQSTSIMIMCTVLEFNLWYSYLVSVISAYALGVARSMICVPQSIRMNRTSMSEYIRRYSPSLMPIHQ